MDLVWSLTWLPFNDLATKAVQSHGHLYSLTIIIKTLTLWGTIFSDHYLAADHFPTPLDKQSTNDRSVFPPCSPASWWFSVGIFDKSTKICIQVLFNALFQDLIAPFEKKCLDPVLTWHDMTWFLPNFAFSLKKKVESVLQWDITPTTMKIDPQECFRCHDMAWHDMKWHNMIFAKFCIFLKNKAESVLLQDTMKTGHDMIWCDMILA